MYELTKDIVVGNSRFQISRFSARVGSWVAIQVMIKGLPAWLGEVESDIPDAMRNNRASLTEEEFHNIQDHCLKICSKWPEADAVVQAPVPIVMVDGRFTDPAMATDVVTVMALTAHALMFNVAPFFGSDALKMVMSSFQPPSKK